jgi:hypothetical protein
MTEPEVEFFDPEMRSELERRDAEVIKKNGRGKANEMVWLTSYSRIPVSLSLDTKQNALSHFRYYHSLFV